MHSYISTSRRSHGAVSNRVSGTARGCNAWRVVCNGAFGYFSFSVEQATRLPFYRLTVWAWRLAVGSLPLPPFRVLSALPAVAGVPRLQFHSYLFGRTAHSMFLLDTSSPPVNPQFFRGRSTYALPLRFLIFVLHEPVLVDITYLPFDTFALTMFSATLITLLYSFVFVHKREQAFLRYWACTYLIGLHFMLFAGVTTMAISCVPDVVGESDILRICGCIVSARLTIAIIPPIAYSLAICAIALISR